METKKITENLKLKSNLKGMNAIVDDESGQEVLISDETYKEIKENVSIGEGREGIIFQVLKVEDYRGDKEEFTINDVLFHKFLEVDIDGR